MCVLRLLPNYIISFFLSFFYILHVQSPLCCFIIPGLFVFNFYTHMQSYIHKYNLLHLYNITCIYVFITDCLVLDNQLVYSSLEETIYPALFILWLPVMLSVRLFHVCYVCPCARNIQGAMLLRLHRLHVYSGISVFLKKSINIQKNNYLRVFVYFFANNSFNFVLLLDRFHNQLSQLEFLLL